MEIVIIIVSIVIIIAIFSGNKKKEVQPYRQQIEKRRSTHDYFSEEEKTPRKEAKPLKEAISFLRIQVSDNEENFTYIVKNIRMYDTVTINFNEYGWFVIDEKGKNLGRLVQIPESVKLTIEANPHHYAFVSGLPYWEDYYDRLEGVLSIGIFLGWDKETNFKYYYPDKRSDGARSMVSNSPCYPFTNEIKLSNRKDDLWTQSSLLINSGYLENALEALLKLWNKKKTWSHDLLKITRKLKKLDQEKELINQYFEKKGKTKEYLKRLEVINKRLKK